MKDGREYEERSTSELAGNHEYIMKNNQSNKFRVLICHNRDPQ